MKCDFILWVKSPRTASHGFLMDYFLKHSLDSRHAMSFKILVILSGHRLKLLIPIRSSLLWCYFKSCIFASYTCLNMAGLDNLHWKIFCWSLLWYAGSQAMVRQVSDRCMQICYEAIRDFRFHRSSKLENAALLSAAMQLQTLVTKCASNHDYQDMAGVFEEQLVAAAQRRYHSLLSTSSDDAGKPLFVLKKLRSSVKPYCLTCVILRLCVSAPGRKRCDPTEELQILKLLLLTGQSSAFPFDCFLFTWASALMPISFPLQAIYL